MALTETLQNGLDSYGIGPKVRELRRRKRMGLVELGAHSGLSAALLSKIERGRMYPTLPTLLRIALVFSVGLDYFFSHEEPVVTVVRRGDRLRLPERMGTRDVAYYFESLDFRAEKKKMNSYLGEFEARPVEDVRLHKHDGAELVYVLEGELGLYVRDREETLAAGDAAYLDGTALHGYRRVSREPCRALVVTVP